MSLQFRLHFLKFTDRRLLFTTLNIGLWYYMIIWPQNICTSQLFIDMIFYGYYGKWKFRRLYDQVIAKGSTKKLLNQHKGLAKFCLRILSRSVCDSYLQVTDLRNFKGLGYTLPKSPYYPSRLSKQDLPQVKFPSWAPDLATRRRRRWNCFWSSILFFQTSYYSIMNDSQIFPE